MRHPEIWARLVQLCGGRRYPALEKYLGEAPVEVWHDLARLVQDFTSEAVNRGRQEARRAFQQGRFF